MSGSDNSAFTTSQQNEGEQFRSLFKEIPLPAFIFKKIDQRYILKEFNKRAETVTNNRVQKMVDEPAEKLYPNMQDLLTDLEECYKTHAQVRREVHYTSPSTGIEVDLILSYSFVEPAYVCMYTMDITPIKRREEAEALIEQIQAIQELAATIAHEFNNPVATIHAAVDLLLKNTHVEPDLLKKLTIIHEQVIRMELLVKQLLEVHELKRKDYAEGVKILDLGASSKNK